MTKELVFLLEEYSSAALLESLLPRFLDDRIVPRMIPFEGKQDLERHLVRRIRGYQNAQARFIVLRDQDSHPDCIQLKQRLSELCNQSGKTAACLIRVACRELETFYLADLAATEVALGLSGLAKQQGNRKFRSPDHLGNPSQELRTLTRGKYQKVSGSREIGKHLALNNQRSASFRNLISGIRKMEAALLA
ncbi:MAG: DUF4276 family protein [Pseudomonadales bacterium]|jgi:predicted DNA-binding protein|nr:DUF4276 family protein [Pseudomonadales bacterium]